MKNGHRDRPEENFPPQILRPSIIPSPGGSDTRLRIGLPAEQLVQSSVGVACDERYYRTAMPFVLLTPTQSDRILRYRNRSAGKVSVLPASGMTAETVNSGVIIWLP
jgi:hypothetical protein